MEDWLVWFVGAVVLLVAEMLAPGFWLACLAVGCVAAGLVGLLPFAGLTLQTVVFAATSLGSMIGLRPLMLRHFQLGPGGAVRTGVDALLGKRGVVLERIDPVSRQGRVKVEGEDWRGASVDDSPIEVGARVTVIQVDGTTLVVEKES
ncbi:MAG TPA: NfeD family protein [Gemmatimonadales bacterium]|jgi:membrane protein implicated in regulation of membrane protease activity|nr:NfeD family protein [Gemmatimonadales bacterium]